MPAKRAAATYVPDRPCRRGHTSPRYVADGKCVACALLRRNSPEQRARDANRRAERRDELRSYHKAWRDQNQDRVHAYNQQDRERHGEKRNAYIREWNAKNPDRCRENRRSYRALDPERWRVYSKEWKRQNSHLVAHYRAKRRGLMRRAMPLWADVEAIERFYEEARRLTERTGVLHHVDHIVPIVHDLVCGLHVPANLRVVTAQENWEKNNIFDPTHAAAVDGGLSDA